MIRVILNSDDFGLSASINDAIISAFYQKLISSTTTLVNYPDGLIDGRAKLLDNNISMSAVGIHLNLTTGKPLTESISKNSKFCEDGSFHAKLRDKPLIFLDKKSRIDVELELEAQIQRFIEVMGNKPSHIDGHHHIHTEFGIFRIVLSLAEKYKIGSMRKSRNLAINKISLSKKLYKVILNSLIDWNFKSTDYFGSLIDIENESLDFKKTYEIMVHAVFDDNYPNVVFDDDHVQLSEKIQKVLPNNILRISFSDLKK